MHTKYPLRYVTLTPIDNALKTESSTVLIVLSPISLDNPPFAKMSNQKIVTGPPS